MTQNAGSFLLGALVDPVRQLDAVKESRVAQAGEAILGQQAGAQAAIADDRIAAQSALGSLGAVAGSFNRALLLQVDPSIIAPPTMGWRSTAGRWRREANGWAICAANGERPFYDTAGGLRGVLLEGAATVYSAPWHDPAAPHTATDPAYLTKGLSGDAIAYAGAHALPDIHGAAGRCVRLTQGAVGNGIFNAAAVAVDAADGDIIRIDGLFSFEPTGVASTFALRNFPKTGSNVSRNVVVSLDGDGAITGWATSINPATYRAGYAQVDVRSDGRPVWYIWMEYRSLAASVTPSIGFGTLNPTAGRTVGVHELRIQRNPMTPPSAAPVLAAAKTFAADTVLTGIRQQVGVIFHRLKRCRSKISDGQLSVAPSPYISGPYMPIETRIDVVPSGEAEDVVGILPGDRQDEDFTPWLNPATHRITLGPGYFNQRLSHTIGKSAANVAITSAFKRDPMRMGMLERLRTSRTYLTGTLTLEDLILFSRASEIDHQFEQVDLLPGDASLHNASVGGSFTFRRSLSVSHPPTHSRARHEVQVDDDPVKSMAWIGGLHTTTTNGGDVDVRDSFFWRMGRGLTTGALAMTTPIRLLADGAAFHQLWSDCLYIAAGTYNITCDRLLVGHFTAAKSSLWQSRREIEVDIGNGWQSFTSAGIPTTALPIGRRAMYWGRYDFATGKLTEDPVADRTLVVRSWIRGASNTADKPGWQWQAGQATWANEDRYPLVGDVYVLSSENSAPSPATPRVRLTFDLGSYPASGGAYVTGPNPAMMNSGTHADAIQVNRTTVVVDSIRGDDTFMLGDAQWLFLTGNTSMRLTDSDIKYARFDRAVVVTVGSTLMAFDLARSPGARCEISNLLALPLDTAFRFADGKRPYLQVSIDGPNNTVGVSNVYLANPAGFNPGSGTSGGKLEGTIQNVGAADITGYVLTPPGAVPAIQHMVDSRWLEPKTLAIRADIDPFDPAFGFTAYAEVRTGIPLNAILKRARGDHARWDAVRAFIAQFHRKPDFTVKVSAGAAVGTAVLDGLKGSAWMPLYSGAEKGFFALESGRLVVAKSLTGINECWLLATAAGEHILIDIQ